jgi:3-methyladenine DNA glycosylase AlkD
MSDNPFIAGLRKEFEPQTNLEKAVSMSKYMKNRFPFLGINSPTRVQLTRNYLKKISFRPGPETPSLIQSLWNEPEREFQYVGMELAEKWQKKSGPEAIDLLERLIVEKSWWDSVDFLAAHPVGTLLYKHPDLIPKTTSRWMDSGNIWLQRTCLLFQLRYKSETRFELLASFVRSLADSDEFFIRKAIGWSLREYGKTDPERVFGFCQQTSLSNLSKKEALRIILSANLS